jgi:hypothetical protein
LKKGFKLSFVFIFVLDFLISNVSAQCNGVSVSAPKDLTICSPQNVVLNGTISGNYLGYEWSGTDGFFTKDNLKPTVNVTKKTSYKLKALVLPTSGPNLISNGDFESGNNKFSTQYKYVANPGSRAIWNEGTYTIAKNPNNYHQNFGSCTDHTSKNGNMMILNGSRSLSVIWCQTISVAPNTYYAFGAWATSVETSSPAELQFSINKKLIGRIFNLSSTKCQWQNFYSLWYSGSETSVEICVTNQNIAESGNDFALDDITFRKACEVEDSFTVDIANFTPKITGNLKLDCITPNSTLTANTSPNGYYTYKWNSSSNFTRGAKDNEIVVTNGGTFNLVVTDQNQCTRTTSIVVAEDKDIPKSTFIVSDTLDCNTGETNIFSSASDPNLTFRWQGPNGFSSNQKDIKVNTEGKYNVIITNPINQCTKSYTIDVFKNTNLPSSNLIKDRDLTCSNKVVNLASTNSTLGIKYLWSGPGIIGTNFIGSSVNVNTPGQYKLLVTNSNGCSDIKTIDVQLTESNIKITSPNQQTINCTEDSIQLVAIINGKWDFIQWTGPASFKSSSLQPFIIIEGDYFISAFDANGCEIKDTISVLKNTPNFVPQITGNLKLDCITPNSTLTANTSPNGNYTYKWEFF